MTYLVERLAELRLHLDRLREIRPRIGDPLELTRNMSLRNDVLFSLLIICRVVKRLADHRGAVPITQGLSG